jgi:fluoride exporter
MTWIAIGLGGALGAVVRHAITVLVRRQLLVTRFPAGIFTINIAGSFAIGVIGGLIAGNRVTWSHEMRAFILVGVLGGFTTFSSFSFDTLMLFREGFRAQAACNVAGQVIGSLLAVWVGFGLGLRA